MHVLELCNHRDFLLSSIIQVHLDVLVAMQSQAPWVSSHKPWVDREYAEKQLADAEEIHDKLQWQLKRAKKMIREAKTELRSVIAREDG